MTLNFILGTAAELIKVYPIIHMSMERGHRVRITGTGQSRENFLMQYRDFKLPESSLTWLRDGSDLEKSSAALKWFFSSLFTSKRSIRSKLLIDPGSTYVVVHGDTLSTLIGSFFGRRIGIPVVHIEAGLRSPSLLNPFPEEITRRLVSRLAKIHVAPDERAKGNLTNAGISGNIISSNGNTLIDAVRLGSLSPGHIHRDKFALVNIHRFENLNSAARWGAIVDTLVKAAKLRPLVMVMHPQTRHKLAQDKVAGDRLKAAKIEIRERMPFTEFIRLLHASDFLISDGGSNQEECSYLGKPCLLLREATERTEGLDSCCVLTKFDGATIDKFLADPQAYKAPALDAKYSPTKSILDFLETN